MENKHHWIDYDWFKLFVALVLLILFLVLLITMRPSPPTAAASLPEYPPASFTWNYNTANQALLDPQGVTLFKLSNDGKTWVPVIPDEIGESLPALNKLAWDTEKGWVLKDMEGKTLYIWDAVAFKWNKVQAAEVSSPQPAASSTPDPTEAPTEAPVAVTTAIPTEAPAAVPTNAPTAVPTSTPAATPPAAEAAAVTDVQDCQPPVPSRLVIGKNARILSNLNQRSEPGLGDNILTANPAGEVLKLLDGPVCVPFKDSAYLWWQVENPKGIIGWSAENLLSGGGYFLAPLP